VERGVVFQSDESDVILKIPNKLLITPYHVQARDFSLEGSGPRLTYKEVFDLSP
jgi:hypothetical protein